MIGLLILALLVLTQIVIAYNLASNSMKYFKHLQTTCKDFSVMCKNESNWDLCKFAAQLSKDAVKFDEKNPEPKYKESCCGNPPDNKTWMALNNTTVEDETENGFTKNCMNS